MEDLIVIIIKLIIRAISSVSEQAPPRAQPAPAPPKVASPPPLSPAQSAARLRTASSKRKSPRGSAPAARVVAPTPRPSVEEAVQVARTSSPAAQIAEALRSRRNLATALMMTELVARPVALRGESN